MWQFGLISLFLMCLPAAFAQSPEAPAPATGDPPLIRGWADAVGFCQTSEEMMAVLRAGGASRAVAADQTPWVAAICPHDDHLYAGRVYQKVMPGMRAKHVILIGVAHKARRWGVRDKLIFDDFDAWSGPWEPVAVSPLREQILARMDPQHVVVSNPFHQEEHSLEALIPYLQAYHPKAQIVPILVPYMDWPRIDELAGELAEHLAALMLRDDLHLVDDVAVLISNDCVHYGDEGWGEVSYADFGVDRAGYDAAVKRDRDLIASYLEGPIRAVHLKEFLYRLVDQEDVTRYRIPWCGRFSIPLGLDLTFHLAQRLGQETPKGVFLDYATSVEPGKLPVEMEGLGVTAPASLRHWVGYAAIGYR